MSKFKDFKFHVQLASDMEQFESISAKLLTKNALGTLDQVLDDLASSIYDNLTEEAVADLIRMADSDPEFDSHEQIFKWGKEEENGNV